MLDGIFLPLTHIETEELPQNIELLYEKKQYCDIISLYSKHRENCDILYVVANCYLHKEDFFNSLKYVGKAIKISDNYHHLIHLESSAIYLQKARILLKQGVISDALIAAKDALHMDHENHIAEYIMKCITDNIVFNFEVENHKYEGWAGDLPSDLTILDKNIIDVKEKHARYHRDAAYHYILRGIILYKLNQLTLAQNDVVKAQTLDSSIFEIKILRENILLQQLISNK